MRELGIIPEERNARALADYLLTQDIASKLVANRDGRFGVWVIREDRMADARQVYDEFLRDPDAERFHSASRSAHAIRKQVEAAEKEHRRRSLDLRGRWEGPIYRRAPVTAVLFAVSVAVFVAERIDPMVYYRLMFSTFAITEDGDFKDLGIRAILQGQVWRLLTPIFLHFGGFHILFNMLALLSFGQLIEMVKGRTKYLLLVVVAGILGNLGQYYVSGGLFGGMSGVLYALAAYLWIKGQVAPEEGLGLSERNAQLFYLWFLLGIVAPIFYPRGEGMIFQMGNMAHGVGLLTGLVFGLLRF